MDQSFRQMCLDFAHIYFNGYVEAKREGLPTTMAWNRRNALRWLRLARKVPQ